MRQAARVFVLLAAFSALHGCAASTVAAAAAAPLDSAAISAAGDAGTGASAAPARRRLQDGDGGDGNGGAPAPTEAQLIANRGAESIMRWADVDGEPCGTFELVRVPADEANGAPPSLQLRTHCGNDDSGDGDAKGVLLAVPADPGDAILVNAPIRVRSDAYDTGDVDVGAELAALRAQVRQLSTAVLLLGGDPDVNATVLRMCSEDTARSGATVIDPDGAAGPNKPFTVHCDNGWTLIAHIRVTVGAASPLLPDWKDAWFTEAHGDVVDYPQTNSDADSLDFRLLEAAIDDNTVLRFTNDQNAVNRYMFGFSQESWTDWYASSNALAGTYSPVIGPCEHRIEMRASRNADLSGHVKCRQNGWWDGTYSGMEFGTAPQQHFDDNEGLGARYGRNTHSNGAINSIGNANVGGSWYWWLTSIDGVPAPSAPLTMCADDPTQTGVTYIDPDGPSGDGAPFLAHCDDGWTLIAQLYVTVGSTSPQLPDWSDDWFTKEHGSLGLGMRDSGDAHNFPFQRFEPIIASDTVLRFTNNKNSNNRYMFGFTQESWTDWYASSQGISGTYSPVIGPCEHRDEMRASANSDLSGDVKCRQNGWWDATYGGMEFGTAPQNSWGDSEGIGARYGRNTHSNGAVSSIGDVQTSGYWYWWLK